MKSDTKMKHKKKPKKIKCACWKKYWRKMLEKPRFGCEVMKI